MTLKFVSQTLFLSMALVTLGQLTLNLRPCSIRDRTGVTEPITLDL